ncbi:MAG: hypothetical protein ABIT01_08785 [Thermoanaerobaculia bacterium]
MQDALVPRRKLVRTFSLGGAAFASLLLASGALAQDVGSVVSESGLVSTAGKFRLKGEFRVNGRSSRDETLTFTPAAPAQPFNETVVSPHSSFEISNVAIVGEGDFTPDISGRVVVHFIDLYTRNPTSAGVTVSVREAWLRFGRKFESLTPIPGTTLYIQAGKAPRFHKQVLRKLESYGLWGTAVARLEEVGVELGGTLGRNVYWRGAVSNGNPLFLRDPNALSGNNGALDRTTNAAITSGFPILYEARADDFNTRGQFQYGGGLGFRFNFGEAKKNGVDVLGWYFQRTLAERPTSELDLLRGFGGVSLPLDGTDKTTIGVNLEARFGGLQLFGQFIHEDIAGFVRKGFEAEAAFRIPLNGVFASGDTSVLNWIQPTVRVSQFDVEFAPAGYFAPSIGWDWTKYDFGFRLGIVRGIDFTAEYSRHDVTSKARVIHPDEFLATLRVGF